MHFYIYLILFLEICLSLPLNKIFNGQDKICTNNYADGQVSVRSILRQLIGVPKHHFLSKQVNRFVIPTEYTGFKILKKHTLKNGMSDLYSDISINYCHEGELSWSKDIPIIKNEQQNLQWKEPICFLHNTEKEMIDDKEINTETVYEPEKLSKFAKLKIWALEFMKIKQKTFKDKYTLKDIASTVPDSLQCYKLARRKKYAHQDLNIFLPNQYIGGLFKCDLPSLIKQDLIENNMDDNLQWIRDNDTLDYVSTLCNSNNSKPILPLIGDNFENYWSEYNGLNKKDNNIFMNISKQVPFLYTPHIIDVSANTTNSQNYIGPENSNAVEWTHTWKFKLLDKFRSKSKATKNWYNEINVSENYNYDLEEMNKLEKFTDFMLNKIQNLTDSEILKKMDLIDSIDQDKQSKIGSFAKLPKKIIFSSLSMQDKVITILASKLFKNQIKDIIEQNDRLEFKKENFKYEEI
ncbi:hypothetical protein HANVADRAFT_7279 [Hanseniaspora valbyensis NRRL Y-1626]|uniref:Uncharacterized protein n=1 Tax=Hanseniaspora valbyensis NRRL Y-1626 TaxID=766949 RepID=A0A1B7TBZ4_9ASCO|nr:hypothetical protein HANVADRAFT_7279 [Hanseniaspora valbyensis NRRL Y-1626]